MEKVNYLQLQQYHNDITNFISDQESLSTPLLFKLRTNIRKVESAMEIIEEDFQSLNEEQQQSFQKFHQERMKLIKEHGGDVLNTGNGFEVTNHEELNQNSHFTQSMDELTDEYQELLDTMSENEKANLERAKEPVADIDFKPVGVELFPAELTDFPPSFLDFVVE